MSLRHALNVYTYAVIARNNQDDIEAAVEGLEAAIASVVAAAITAPAPAPAPAPNPLAEALG